MKLTWYMYHLSTFHFQKNEGENESTFGRLPLQQHFSFRDLMIRLSGPLQLPSILNDNSFLKTFLRKFITSWYTIIFISFLCCNVFYMIYVFFVFCCFFFTGKATKQTTTKKPIFFLIWTTLGSSLGRKGGLSLIYLSSSTGKERGTDGGFMPTFCR